MQGAANEKKNLKTTVPNRSKERPVEHISHSIFPFVFV